MTQHPDRPTEPLYGEDLTVGASYALGSHTPSRQEIVDFARMWDPQTFHLGPTDAGSGGWGDVIASGAHTLAIFQRLSVTHVEHAWAVVAGIGLDDVRFLRPVRPDEPLTGHARLDAIDMVRADRALVVKSGSLVGPTGETAFSVVTRAYVRRRPTGTDATPTTSRVGG